MSEAVGTKKEILKEGSTVLITALGSWGHIEKETPKGGLRS
jgi:hypothetical protein